MRSAKPVLAALATAVLATAALVAFAAPAVAGPVPTGGSFAAAVRPADGPCAGRACAGDARPEPVAVTRHRG